MTLLRCAYCHEETPELEACSTCGTLLHAECWAVAGACPSIGCVGPYRELGPRVPCGACGDGVARSKFAYCTACFLWFHLDCSRACSSCGSRELLRHRGEHSSVGDAIAVWGLYLIPVLAILCWAVGVDLDRYGLAVLGAGAALAAVGGWLHLRQDRGRVQRQLDALYAAGMLNEGLRRLARGDGEGAIVGTSNVLAVTRDPKLMGDVHWFRGAAHLIEDDHAAAVRDLRVAQAVQPVRAAVFLTALGVETEPPPLSNAWEEALWAFVQDRDGERLLAAAEEGEPEGRVERLAEARDFLGLFAERAGRIDEARAHYRACVELVREPSVVTALARGRLRRLGARGSEPISARTPEPEGS